MTGGAVPLTGGAVPLTGGAVWFAGGCVPLTGGAVVAPFMGDADAAYRSTGLALPQRSATPPADTGNMEGILSDAPNSTCIAAFSKSCRTASTGISISSASRTMIFRASTPDMGSLNAAFRMLSPASQIADGA